MATVEAYLHNLYCTSGDFVYSVSRDFVLSWQTPMLIMPDDVPAHPYAVCVDIAALAPQVQVTMYPWKEPKDLIPWRYATCVTSSGRINRCRQPTETDGEAPTRDATVPPRLDDDARGKPRPTEPWLYHGACGRVAVYARPGWHGRCLRS